MTSPLIRSFCYRRAAYPYSDPSFIRTGLTFVTATHIRTRIIGDNYPQKFLIRYSTKPKHPQQRQDATASDTGPDELRSTSSVSGHVSRREKKKMKKQINKADDQKPIYDESYVRNHYTIPTAEDYPNAPSDLFNPLKISHHLNNLVDWQTIQITKDLHIRGGYFEWLIHIKSMTGDEAHVIGHGPSKIVALRTAYLHLLAKCHGNGLFSRLFSDSVPTVDRETLQEDKDAIVDVYNYSARFGTLPEITRLHAVRIRGGKKIKVHEVTICLERQNLKAIGVDTDLSNAELIAAIKFKQKAEKHHAEHGEKSIALNDASQLNLQTVSNFVKFCDSRYDAPRVDLQLTSLDNGWEGQALVDQIPVGSPVRLRNKASAENTALLVAASSIVSKRPELLESFQRSLSPTGKLLLPLHPVKVDIDPDAIFLMEKTLHGARSSGLKDEREPSIPTEADGFRVLRQTPRHLLSNEELITKSQFMMAQRLKWVNSHKLQELRTKKESLPINQNRDEILEHVEKNAYSIIIGATGSGKTTQVPQILLDYAISKGKGATCNIICTQPRRIAATSVARRVADERNETLGQSVGYHVRFDHQKPEYDGSIVYSTTGTLLQQLRYNPDVVLERMTHVLIDEVHERDTATDILMATLKRIIRDRHARGLDVPKVVLMSATVDSELISKYFEETTVEGQVLPCPSLSVAGRAFPVTERYLESILHELEKTHPDVHKFLRLDTATTNFLKAEKTFMPALTVNKAASEVEDEARIEWKRKLAVGQDIKSADEQEEALVPYYLVAATIAHICKANQVGAILVFLPGVDDIQTIHDVLLDGYPLGIDFNNQEKFKVCKLFSSLPLSEQQEVFKSVAHDCRKIILATNIAETSITIPDVEYVVDSGKLRQTRFDQVSGASSLQTTWISRSNAKQRAGRAGRVKDGCYYALYTKSRADSFSNTGLPEILRSSLQEVCLYIKTQTLKVDIREFLSETIEPPSTSSIDIAITKLKGLGALTEDEELTTLGHVMSTLPMPPSFARMVLLGIIFRCLDPMIILGALHAGEQNFLHDWFEEHGKEARNHRANLIDGSASDHYAHVNAFRQARNIRYVAGEAAFKRFCADHLIRVEGFQRVAGACLDIEHLLIANGLIMPISHRADRYNNEYGDPTLNINSENVALIKALFLSGVQQNLAVALRETLRTAADTKVLLHSSTLGSLRPRHEPLEDASPNWDLGIGALLSYSRHSKTGSGDNVILRDSSRMTPLMALLFGGNLKSFKSVIEIDNWLPLKITGPSRNVDLIMEFRKALDRVLDSAFRDMATLQKSCDPYLIKDRRTKRYRPMTRREKEAAQDPLRAREMRTLENESADKAMLPVAEEERKYLADDPVRDLFARGVTYVLDRDVDPRAGT